MGKERKYFTGEQSNSRNNNEVIGIHACLKEWRGFT